MAAFAAAISLVAVVGGTAFAALPGEGSSWNTEIAGGSPIYAAQGYQEARDNNGNVAQVWVEGDDTIHIAYNNGEPRGWSGALTGWAPRIIWTQWGFRVFHTGLDNHVYYAGFQVNADGSLNLGTWQQIPGNVVTNQPVGVSGLNGSRQEEWMLAWRGMDGRVYAQYHLRDNYALVWATPVAITNAVSNYGPAVAYDPTHGIITTVWTGTDGNEYSADQPYGQPYWQFYRQQGSEYGRATGAPAASYEINGRGYISISESISHNIDIMEMCNIYEPSCTTYSQPESTNYTTPQAPALSTDGYNIYIEAGSPYTLWVWKPLRDNSGAPPQ